MKKVSRRVVLKGIGGAAIALPFLEGTLANKAFADGHESEPFAVFLRQANGVAQAGDTVAGDEPERFFPDGPGPLTPEAVEGRALDELEAYLSKLLVVGGVNMNNFDYGDGHARGALQALTAQGPTVAGAGGSSEAAGESLDHRIGRELNPEGRDSLFLYAGRNSGWLGGACVSYRDAGVRRAPLNNPWNAYQQIVGDAGGMDPEALEQIATRRKSVNDLVRKQMQRLTRSSSLSKQDRDRLNLHFEAIRDLELSLSCRLEEDAEAELEGASPGYDSTNGNDVLRTLELHMDVAALAVACGYTRSVAIQVGSGNDGSTRYPHPETGELMENFHYLSHRRLSHDSSGSVIADSDLLHHYVDRHFAAAFRHLLDRLSAYDMPDGGTLLDHGVAVWLNDNANGPPHGINNVPYVLAGSADGFLRQGQYIRLDGGGPNHAQVLNTIGTAVGLKNSDGSPLDNFGASGLPGGLRSELMT